MVNKMANKHKAKYYLVKAEKGAVKGAVAIGHGAVAIERGAVKAYKFATSKKAKRVYRSIGKGVRKYADKSAKVSKELNMFYGGFESPFGNTNYPRKGKRRGRNGGDGMYGTGYMQY